MFERVLSSEEETLALAAKVAGLLAPGDVLGLEGGLGAGKTTFTRAAIYALGVPEETAVTSPTFALLHHYNGSAPIGHADFYRLEAEAELEQLGLDELIDGGAILFVEWGRKFSWVRERASAWVDLELVSEHARRVRIAPRGERGTTLARGLGPLFSASLGSR